MLWALAGALSVALAVTAWTWPVAVRRRRAHAALVRDAVARMCAQGDRPTRLCRLARITRPTSLIWRGSANQRMVPRTDPGRRRYAEHVDHEPERAPMQVRADGGGIWLIGTPRQGGLAALERGLRASGLPVESASWRLRPPGRSG